MKLFEFFNEDIHTLSENVTPNITQSKKEEIISEWEWQENLIEIGNGMLIIPAQKQDGTMHTSPDGKGGFIPYNENDILLIDKDYNVLDFDDDIEDLLDNNFGIIQGENFADGKKKGKSRPGRVKRSGASCNGSVTALRKRAKNSSGEKAKMYHWCANMKSGKKKSK